jgi:hypothetical protein
METMRKCLHDSGKQDRAAAGTLQNLQGLVEKKKTSLMRHQNVYLVCLLPVGMTYSGRLWQRNGAKLQSKRGWLLYYLKKDTYVHDSSMIGCC